MFYEVIDKCFRVSTTYFERLGTKYEGFAVNLIKEANPGLRLRIKVVQLGGVPTY